MCVRCWGENTEKSMIFHSFQYMFQGHWETLVCSFMSDLYQIFVF